MKKEFPYKKTLIIFTGGPGTGKSETSQRFLNYLDNNDIVKISYDAIKEKNWDRFGFENETQKERLNEWSLEEFYLTIKNMMIKNKTILIEYPFYQRHKEKLLELIKISEYYVVTIFLFTDMQTAYQRGVKRDIENDRHPGHLLSVYYREIYEPKVLLQKSRIKLTFDEFVESIQHKEYNIKLGFSIAIDVTNFDKINYEKIYNDIINYQKNESD